MMQKSLTFALIAAAVAAASCAVPATAQPRYYRDYDYDNYYWGAPWHWHRFGPPYHYRHYGPYYRHYERFGSNLNPDRQMVGQGD